MREKFVKIRIRIAGLQGREKESELWFHMYSNFKMRTYNICYRIIDGEYNDNMIISVLILFKNKREKKMRSFEVQIFNTVLRFGEWHVFTKIWSIFATSVRFYFPKQINFTPSICLVEWLVTPMLHKYAISVGFKNALLKP